MNAETTCRGGHGVVEITDGVIYLAMGLRNVGRGMGVLHGWLATGYRRLDGSDPR